MSLSRDEKLQDIKNFIQKDLLAADLKLSLFISAAKCYKKDFLVNPFPAFYIKNHIKDFDKLAEDLDQIPPLEELLLLLIAEFGSDQLLSDTVINLLHWVLIEYLKYDVQTVHKSKHEEILLLSKSTGKYQVPNYIFQINYKNTSAAERKFNQLKFGNTTKFAYHGTKFYCMYSILNYGLQQHLNKTALFGEGLYFSYELQVSQLFSQSVLSWNRSKLGELISCTAVCEYIDDPLYTKIRKENAKNSDIPQNYLLITNNEIVRPRYLLIYGSNKPTLKKSISANVVNNSIELIDEPRTFLTWCRRNPLIVSAAIYLLLLFLVGLSSHRSFDHYKNILMNFFKKRFKYE
ncbi:protein mono-ADP-ribosyltransferase PARP16-like [Chironomus tepperi]|uniref:protein mono-ADP-ribosyltransferase PARP16-like n=1 Tax=Chironomus tepperi TaxID=113505 RepID=UPI00391F331F